MPLPHALLAAAELHPCFTGCYSNEGPVNLCVDPVTPPVLSYTVQCQDCLMFRLATLASLLPTGYDALRVARELSAHNAGVRGYTWAVSGYHAVTSAGFWFSGVSFGNGVLLVDAARNRSGGDDLDTLIEAYRANLATPEDPGMLDPSKYSTEVVHVDLSRPFGVVRSKHDILQSPQCSPVSRPGFHRVTLLEYLPLIQAAQPPPAPTASAPAPTPPDPRPLALGERCPVCSAVVMRRQLLEGYFEGCLC